MKVLFLRTDNGKIAPNHYILKSNEYTIFQSYDSIIVKIIHNSNGVDEIFLDPVYYNYSNTTSKYRNMFLKTNSKEIELGIKSGKYKTFINLN